MHMKRYVFIIMMIAGCIAASAQGVQLGVRAGINSGNLTTKLPGIIQGTEQRGFVMGAFARATALGFLVQPELNFSQRVGKFEDPAVGGAFTNTLSYVDVSVLVGYGVLGLLRVNFGPTLMTLVSASQSRDNSIINRNFKKDNYNSTAYGFQIGAGFDISKFCIDIRYDTNITNLGKNGITGSGGPWDYRTGFGMYQVTIGYKIIKL